MANFVKHKLSEFEERSIKNNAFYSLKSKQVN